jgi:hypothetical protein
MIADLTGLPFRSPPNLKLGFLTGEAFDEIVHPEAMINP